MELILKRNLDEILPAAIEFNFDELKQQLTAFVAKYEGKVVRPENEAEGKADRAGLNRLEAAFDEARKRVKQRCLAPYQTFEAKVKELTGLIAPVRDAIDGQLKAMEEARRTERRTAIETFFAERVGDLDGLVPLARVWNEKWLNRTTTDGTWQSELLAVLTRIRQGLASVRGVAPDRYKAEAEAKFLETFDFPTVFSFLEERKRQDLMLEARRKRAEEEAARAREAARAQSAANAQETAQERPETAPAPASPAVVEPPAPPPPAPQPEIEEYVLRFRGTRAQLLGLRDYMRANGIWYEKVRVGTEVAE